MGKSHEFRLQGDGYAGSGSHGFPDVLSQGNYIVRRCPALVQQYQRLRLIHLRAADAITLKPADFNQEGGGNLDPVLRRETIPDLFQSRHFSRRKIPPQLLPQVFVFGFGKHQILEE